MLVFAALALMAQDAPAQEPPPPIHYGYTDITCPVGGEKFRATTLAHYSTMGALPDGQPRASVPFPPEIPECPSNGLVVFRAFTPEESERLAALIAAPDYAALSGESRYYRAHWLEKALGEDANAAWLLLSATWEAKNAKNAARAEAYNRAFVALAATLPRDPSDLESVALHARAANALRELGDFRQAEALRASIVIAPDAGGAERNAAENRSGWRGYLDSLADPIARGDRDRQPIDLLDERSAAYRCVLPEWRPDQVPPLSAFERSFCERPELAAKVGEIRAQLIR